MSHIQNQIFNENLQELMERPTKVRITIETEDGDIYRNYFWGVDGDLEAKGKVVEDMMKTLKQSKVPF